MPGYLGGTDTQSVICEHDDGCGEPHQRDAQDSGRHKNRAPDQCAQGKSVCPAQKTRQAHNNEPYPPSRPEAFS